MQERYLCRGKRIDTGEWVIGFYFCMTHPDGRHMHHFIIPLGTDLGLGTPIEKIQVEVDPSTICRCTGRADCVGEVVWDEETLSFQVANRLSAESWEVLDGECKVFGNTIDNPELLEV